MHNGSMGHKTSVSETKRTALAVRSEAKPNSFEVEAIVFHSDCFPCLVGASSIDWEEEFWHKPGKIMGCIVEQDYRFSRSYFCIPFWESSLRLAGHKIGLCWVGKTGLSEFPYSDRNGKILSCSTSAVPLNQTRCSAKMPLNRASFCWSKDD